MTKLWINAGELSGDIHGGELLRALRESDPAIEAFGMGGTNMAAEGLHTVLRVESLSVLGITEVLTALPRAVRMLRRVHRELESRKKASMIDAVVLIDAPEFNFWVARIARDLDIPVYYHIPPKVWAWRTGRVRFLAKHIKKMFCILPFEPDFYQKHGIGKDQAVFIGNPLVDLVNWPELSPIQPVPTRVGIMPGSRRAEVQTLMRVFGETARRLMRERNLEFCCLRAPNMQEATLRSFWPSDVPLTIVEPEDRYRAMRSCACIMAASGTATLEAALAGTPTLIAYKVSALSYQVALRMIRVPWVGLPNLILGEEVFPECLQHKAHPDTIAPIIGSWLDNPDQLKSIRARLDILRQRCGEPGSAARAARMLLADLAHTQAGSGQKM